MKSCTALLIIDVQVGSFEERKVLYNETELLRVIRLLISKARSASAPIFYMKFNGKSGSTLKQGSSGWEIHKSIAPTTYPQNDKINFRSIKTQNFHLEGTLKS
ncbi:hypothetical protein IKQ_06082 [Bacillus cereus VDM053]|nr:hypothetical protein IKQ_06082 [Bacillus cereus VDM053]